MSAPKNAQKKIKILIETFIHCAMRKRRPLFTRKTLFVKLMRIKNDEWDVVVYGGGSGGGGALSLPPPLLFPCNTGRLSFFSWRKRLLLLLQGPLSIFNVTRRPWPAVQVARRRRKKETQQITQQQQRQQQKQLLLRQQQLITIISLSLSMWATDMSQ